MDKMIIERMKGYVQGDIRRQQMIKYAEKYVLSRALPDEALFYALLTEVFDDPEDNLLEVSKKAIQKVLGNYLRRNISKQDLQLWAWDVLHLNYQGNTEEQDLVSSVLYMLDNLEISDLHDIDLVKVKHILDQENDAHLALCKLAALKA